MKMQRIHLFQNAFLLSLLLPYALFLYGRQCEYPLHRVPLDGPSSYFKLSESQTAQGVPVIIHIGSMGERPKEVLLPWIGQIGQPVLLIWSGLLSDLDENTLLEDPVVWERKRREFPQLLSRYQNVFRFDKERVYLTGAGFAGAYAWMLAYDQPGLYAGVVAISAPAYPPPIQQRLDRGKSVVTVVVYGEKERWLTNQLAQWKETTRCIESQNPNSKLLLLPEENRRGVSKYWLESLKYILRFRKQDIELQASGNNVQPE